MHFWASARSRSALEWTPPPFRHLPGEGCWDGQSGQGWAASWHAFHLRSDGCGKRWRWQCVLIAKSALLKPHKVGPGLGDGIESASSTRDFSPRCPSTGAAMDHFDRDLSRRQTAAFNSGRQFGLEFYPGVFILRPRTAKLHARKFGAAKATTRRRASLSLTLFRVESVRDVLN